MQLAEHSKHSTQKMTFQQSSVVAEGEMMRTADCKALPSIRRQTIINRLNVGPDLLALRVGLAAVIAEKKHEWLMDPLRNDVAEGSAVQINACLAPRVVVAKLQSRGATERMPQEADPRQIEPSRKLAGLVSGVQPRQLIKNERDVRVPRSDQSARNWLPGPDSAPTSRRSSHHPAVSETTTSVR